MHFLFPLAGLFCLVSQDPSSPLPRLDFKSRFGAFDGCFAIREVGLDWCLRYNDTRCEEQLSPCSTFKIFNALVGLETGVLADATTTFKWDGTPQRIKGWEKDHNLTTAIRESAVWYFQRVAEKVGAAPMRDWLARVGYGNQDMSAGLTRFWLAGSLKISANQQLRFIESLYTDRLPFARKNVEIVRRILVWQSGDGWALSGKTGSAMTDGRRTLGWYVGHLRTGDRQFVFATNITARDGADGMIARDITSSILRDLGLLPATRGRTSE